MPTGPVIAIVGAGFTGTLTALHLLRAGPPQAQIHLIEKTPGFGRGLAYGAHNPSHLLNVRAGNMSAFPDEPDGLIRWLATRPHLGAPQADAFITRGDYGDYLSGLLRQAIAGADGAERLVLVHDQAVEARLDGRRAEVGLAMGRRLTVDAVVLAVGNLPPTSPGPLALAALGDEFHAPDPWAPGALANLDPEAAVLLLGSGLTMVDIALDLCDRGHRGPLIALSRRGLAPNRHAPVGALGAPPEPDGAPLSAWIKARRERAEVVGWRAAVDELRPIAQRLWREAGPAERRRFLRHLRPWWDVVRHRMAPPVADRIDALRERGQLRVRAGRLLEARADGAAVAVQWRPRGRDQARGERFGRIINCTGPGGDLSRTRDPLLISLIAQGAIRPDPLGLGLEVDADCQAIDASGTSSGQLYAAGPLTQGYSWEVTAVPDIRNQVADLAATLTARLGGGRA